MRTARLTALIALLAVAPALLPAAGAGELLDAVKSRGTLRCGVSEGIPGFSQRDAQGRWQGLDVDFCRAVAAAVVGDAERIEFLPLRASERLPALQGRRIDILSRNTTWTLTREALLKVQFPAILFYDGQGFMVPAGGAQSAAELDGATVCVKRGTHHRRNLERYAERSGLSFKPLVLDTAAELAAAFFAGRCGAYSSDASQLVAARLSAPGGEAGFVILPERISKEPLAPAVLNSDPEWTSVVRWVLFTLILAEEDGVTRANVEAQANSGTTQIGWLTNALKGQMDQALGLKPGWALLGQSLGLKPGWAVRAIQAVGNYGEVYERNLGAGSPLRIERGLNRLWTQGGLMYAPPID